MLLWMSSGESCTLVVLSKQCYGHKGRVETPSTGNSTLFSSEFCILSVSVFKPYNIWRLTRKCVGYFEQSQDSDVNFLSLLLLISFIFSCKIVNV